MKNEGYLNTQREIIRAEERIKFERQYMEGLSQAEEKCRRLREELATKERRMHDDLRVRSDDMNGIFNFFFVFFSNLTAQGYFRKFWNFFEIHLFSFCICKKSEKVSE